LKRIIVIVIMAILINVQLSAETLVEEFKQLKNELLEMKSVL